MAMSTKTLEKEILKLKKEVAQLRSLIIGQAGKDHEGDYRPEFVERILIAAKERPIYTFSGKDSFLKLLNKSR
jgi:hypothetical protein